MRWWIGSLLFIVSSAHGKVFDFEHAHISSYLNGQYGSSNLKDGAYGQAGGTNNVFDEGALTQFAGELGVVYGGGILNLVGTAEILRPTEVVDAYGYSPSGTALMKVTSRLNAVIGSLGVELLLRQRPTSRFLFGAAGGYADITLVNAFTLNNNGQTAYPGVGPTYTESINGQGVSAKAYLGFEFLLTDNVTCTFIGGYRYMQLLSMHFTGSVTTVDSTYDLGSTVKNSDGSDRAIDLGGAYGSIGFRFYFL